MANISPADKNTVQRHSEADNQGMGRGRRRAQTKSAALPLGDPDTRRHLGPLFSPREQLRARYQAFERNTDLRPHELELLEEMEARVVDELDLEEATARVCELESLNGLQRLGLLRHEHERRTGKVDSVELAYLRDDGWTIERLRNKNDCQDFCAELCWPRRAPDIDENEVYVVRDRDGMCFALVIGQAAGTTRSGRPGPLLICDIGGRFPPEEEDCWYEDDLSDAHAPIRDWFGHLLESGREVRWSELAVETIDDADELLSFLWRFQAAPRRYLDGFDERFAIGGPIRAVANNMSVDQCLAVCSDGTFREWTDYPDLIADAFFVAALLDGYDIDQELAGAETKAAEHRRSCADEAEWQARFGAVVVFVTRLCQLVSSVGGETSALATPLPRSSQR